MVTWNLPGNPFLFYRVPDHVTTVIWSEPWDHEIILMLLSQHLAQEISDLMRQQLILYLVLQIRYTFLSDICRMRWDPRVGFFVLLNGSSSQNFVMDELVDNRIEGLVLFFYLFLFDFFFCLVYIYSLTTGF